MSDIMEATQKRKRKKKIIKLSIIKLSRQVLRQMKNLDMTDRRYNKYTSYALIKLHSLPLLSTLALVCFLF